MGWPYTAPGDEWSHPAQVSRSPSVEVEERHDALAVLGLLARLQQQLAVVEGEADDLLHLADDLAVAQPARSRGAQAHCLGHMVTCKHSNRQ